MHLCHGFLTRLIYHWCLYVYLSFLIACEAGWQISRRFDRVSGELRVFGLNMIHGKRKWGREMTATQAEPPSAWWLNLKTQIFGESKRKTGSTAHWTASLPPWNPSKTSARSFPASGAGISVSWRFHRQLTNHIHFLMWRSVSSCVSIHIRKK